VIRVASTVRQAVFDFHARLTPAPGAADRLLATMDRCGIDRAAVCAGGMIDLDLMSRQVIEGGHVETDADNDAVLAGSRQSAGRLVPFYFANPYRSPELYRSRAAQFRGLEISPAVHGVGLTDDRTMDLVAVAAEFDHPVYVVCLGRPGAGAVDLAALAGKFPAVTFVLGHCGFVGIDVYALNAVAPAENVMAETSGCYTVVARKAVDRLGAGRVLFGTEYPAQHPSVELAKFQALDLPRASWRQVAWENAHRLLGEDPS
jgi:predicted TIM-barrel fold metal-dependent hydrolase